MNIFIKFISAMMVFTTPVIADTPPIIYQFAAPLVKTNNKNISIPPATSSADGYLTSGDWTSFNSKQSSITPAATTTYFRGDKTFQTLNTSVVPEGSNLYYTNARSRLAISATSPILYDNSTGIISFAGSSGVSGVTASPPLFSSGGANPNITIQQSDSTHSGYLSSTDWTTFNSKQSAGNYITALTGDVVASGPGSAAATISTGAVTDTKASLANKPPVTVVATTNQALSGLPIIDGFQTSATSVVLLTAQSTGSQNGPWQVQSGAWTRPTWYPSGGTTQAFQFITTLSRLGATYSGTIWRNTTAAPITIDTTATTWVITKINLNASTATKATVSTDGFLSAADWTIFNNKLSASAGNYILNPTFEVDTSGWSLYNDTGNTAPASVINQDITYTSTLSGGSGNGATVTYVLCGSSYIGPVVTCPTGTSVQVCWYNGPSIAQNPTATVLKAAYDAQSCATAIATSAITGTASNRQYITGTSTLADGGDTSPVDGTGGSVSGVTFTRNTSTPLVGVASGDLGKSAANKQGQGLSYDFAINSVDQNTKLQISFVYSGSSGMVLGSSSDARVFVYDTLNNVFIPVKPLKTISGPVSTAKTFVGTFTSTSSATYRLIVHIATTNATAWDLLLDSVTINNQVTASAATQVPSVVVTGQPISGAVTDHMAVMWVDGASQWVPATIAGAALPVFGDDKALLGFATDIVGLTADIYTSGYMGGFSFGPFVGYNQYIDNTAGLISPLPSPFNDLYVVAGTAISSTELIINFQPHVDQIQNGSGVPIKGGLLTSSAINDGTGDLVLSPGANNSVLVANSAASRGLNYVTTLTGINTTGSAATLTTPRTIAGTSFNGSANISLANKFIVQGTADAGLSGPQFLGALATGLVKNTTTTGILSIAAASDTTGVALTGFVSGAGTITATDTILTGFNKINGNDLLKAPLASPTFTGTPSLPTGTTGVTQTAGDSTTALATTAFVTTADNLKANLASPTFSGTPSLPTGTTGVTQTAADSTTKLATTAFVTTADNLKANLASPTFSGTPSLPTGTTGVTQTAADSTTKLATTAFVTTADNLKANLAAPTFTGDVNSSTGNVLISTIGKGLQVKTGTNSKIGQATLVAGTVTVANTSVTANSRIFLTVSTAGGTQGNLRTTKSAGTSFTITSTNAAETSVVDWLIVESIP